MILVHMCLLIIFARLKQKIFKPQFYIFFMHNEEYEIGEISHLFTMKESKMGFWHKRFCVLIIQEMKLKIYHDIARQKLDRSLTITSETECNIKQDSKHPYFTIAGPNFKLLRLADDDSSLLNNWVTTIRAMTMQTPHLTMEDFNVLSVIGRGFYGKVSLCQKINSGQVFAIKSVHKNRLVKAHKCATVVAERNVLMKIDHPFIVKIYFAFQNATKVYMGFEYVPGGDMAFHFNNMKRFKLHDIRLYIAELALALDYIHQKSIIYRDLKPENILLDSEGCIKLTDFGLVKNIAYSKGTTSFCGTPEYIAPEVIKGEKYGEKIDWWALGVLAYNLLYGKPPWSDDNMDKLFDMIINDDVSFPGDAQQVEIDLISNLLNKDPAERKDMKYIINHPFFNGINFNDVLERKIPHEFKPVVLDYNKATNFEKEFLDEPTEDSVGTPVHGANAFDGFSFVANSDTYDDIMDYVLPTPTVLPTSMEMA